MWGSVPSGGRNGGQQQQQVQQQQQQQQGQGVTYTGGRGRGGRGGGRGFQGGRGGGGRFQGPGRGGRGGDANASIAGQEQPIYNICSFFIRDGNCRFGDSCRNSHALVTLFAVSAHEGPTKSLSLLQSGDVRFITGGADNCVKVWNMASTDLTQPELVIPTKGPVQCVEGSNGSILFAADEPIDGDSPDVPQGVVNLLIPGQQNTIPIKVKK